MPGLALAEEEVADDRADHRQPGGDPQPGEHRRQRGGEHQLAQAGEPAGVLQREQVVHPAIGRLQAEQRVHDDREQRDDHADDDPRLAGRCRTRTRSAATIARIGIAWSITMNGNTRALDRAWPGSSARRRATPSDDRDRRSPIMRDLGARPETRRASRRSCPSRGTRPGPPGAAAGAGTAALGRARRYEMKYQIPMTIPPSTKRREHDRRRGVLRVAVAARRRAGAPASGARLDGCERLVDRRGPCCRSGLARRSSSVRSSEGERRSRR